MWSWKAHLDLQILDIVNLRTSIYYDYIENPKFVSDNRVPSSGPGLPLHEEILIPLNIGLVSQEKVFTRYLQSG